MILSDEGIVAKREWEEKGYTLPDYDRHRMKVNTEKSPVWVHFGAGNIFRAFHAQAEQKLLEKGLIESGITVVEGYDTELIEKIWRPFDDLCVLVTLKTDGSVEKTVIGSVGESRILDPGNDREYSRLKEIFRAPSLQMATFSITEKGYNVSDDTGEGPDRPCSYIEKVTALLYERYAAGRLPIALVSTDNCSHNGDRLKSAVLSTARKWSSAGLCDRDFCSYIEDEDKVSFPWSMIDRITPRPDEAVGRILTGDGLEDITITVTSKNTFAAPFVNAEECGYLVIEDSFPAGRPPLEEAGIIFTDRDTVDSAEKMKVCTCLNPLHTGLAIFGCLLGFTKISDEMSDPILRKLVMRLGYEEGLPVASDPGVLDPKEFLDTVINVRLPNPFMPDSPQRIATDTSQKLPVRFGQTVRKYMATDKGTKDLKIIPLVFAGWIRYLMAVDDSGDAFELSSDPMLDVLRPYVINIKLGDKAEAVERIDPLLHDELIFGANLYEAGLADSVRSYFTELIKGKGSVRNTLAKYV